MTIGTQVEYRDRGGRIRHGTIDKTAVHPDGKVYRVDGRRWFQKRYLRECGEMT